MQVQFHKNLVPYLQQINDKVLTQEQTLELRLNEDLPDIGSILGAWGQVLVRGKQWRAGAMELSCGVMVWTMYQPEDGSKPQMVEGWIPFSFKWDLPQTDRDGRMWVTTRLQSVDARVVSAKKLMLRTCVAAMGEAWISNQAEVAVPSEIPEDIQLLKRLYPIMLPSEAGEKAFTIDEELKLPEAAPDMERVLRYCLQPEIIDRKVMGDKVVFRGICLLHILYTGTDGRFYTWDFELPFSQFSDLEREYPPEAFPSVSVEITSAELELEQPGKLHLRAGFTGQYLIHRSTEIELVEDAYSPHRGVSTQIQNLFLPAVLEEQNQTVRAEQTFSAPCSRVVDVAFYPALPQSGQTPNGGEADLMGTFQMLYYDHDQMLCSVSAKWNAPWSFPIEPNVHLRLSGSPTGMPQALAGGQITAQADLLLDIRSTADREIPMICGMEVGEMAEPDPQRPSLILRRAGHDTLWQIAKSTGSTEEAIRQANDLSGTPDPGRMLLIPVV